MTDLRLVSRTWVSFAELNELVNTLKRYYMWQVIRLSPSTMVRTLCHVVVAWSDLVSGPLHDPVVVVGTQSGSAIGV